MRAIHRSQAAMNDLLKEGDIVVDATCGNGNDTWFLCRHVGNSGHVYGFDVQEAAIENTHQRLEKDNLSNATLFLKGHQHMKEMVPKEHHGSIAGVMFNLGYLPGSDMVRITEADSTMNAIQQALEIIQTNGLLSIICYPGHEGGQMESHALLKWHADVLDPSPHFEAEIYEAWRPGSPWVLLVYKRS